MAMQFPAPLADFFGQLPIKSTTLHVPEIVEMSQTGAGDVITASLGARLWRGQVMMGRLSVDEADEAETLIDVLRGAGRSFLISDTLRSGPRLDPTGAILGNAVVKIASIGADNRTLQLKSLPGGYQLKRGDKLAFAYGSSPTRYALHRIVDASVTAAGSGQTPVFEVTPNLRAGAAVNAVVTLKKPSCKAVIVPGSVQPGTRARFITEGLAFDFIQTLR